MTQIELFTSPTCPGAKKVVYQVTEELNSGQASTVNLLEFDTFTEECYSKSVEYGIMAVPTILVSGTCIPQKILIEGAPSKQDLLDAIEMAEGRK